MSRFTIILVLLVAFCVSGCNRKAQNAGEARSAPKHVRVAPAQQLSIEETVYGTGSLAAQDRAVLSAKVPGRVDSIAVDLGSIVRKGDLLAQIQKRDFELRREQAEAAVWQARARLGLALTGEEDKVDPEKSSVVKEAKAVLSEATKNRDRLVKLNEQGIIPESDVESAEAQYQVAVNRYDEATHEAKNRMATLQQRRAELDLAAQELKDTEIRAPFDGVVEQRQTSPGEFLNIGTAILTLVRIDPIRVRLEIAEIDAPRVKADQKLYVQVEGLAQPIEGKIGRLSPVISSGNRMLVVEADIPNPSAILRPGAFAKADIVVNKAAATFVPRSAIVTFAGIQKIFVVEGGKAVEREVTLKRVRGTGERTHGNQVEIEKGVRAGELVVVEPANLRNGQPVETNGRDT